MRCHCDHTDTAHRSDAPYPCRSCSCIAYRWDAIPAGTWIFWSYDREGRPEWRGVPKETVKERAGMKYPMRPLVEFMQPRGGLSMVLERMEPAQRRRWKDRWRKYDREGAIPERAADEFCCTVLGVSPESVWTEEVTAA